ncbi:MAG: type II toxin-antitoxin system RelE/ParE family toxin [Bacteroidota bacterium]
MRYSYTRLFVKQAGKLKDKQLLAALEAGIKGTEDLRGLPKVKKPADYKNYYRLHLQDYRISIQLVDDTAIIACIYYRKGIYRYFP